MGALSAVPFFLLEKGGRHGPREPPPYNPFERGCTLPLAAMAATGAIRGKRRAEAHRNQMPLRGCTLPEQMLELEMATL